MKWLGYDRVASVMTAAVVCLCCVGLVFGQAVQPTLDELLDLTPQSEPAPEPRPDKPMTTDPGEDLFESIEQALSASDAAGVFEQAVEEMGRVSRRLGRSLDPGVETQRMQESILRKLDQVIESAKQQQSSSGGGGSGQPRDQDSGGDELAQQNPAGVGQDQAQAGGNQASTGAAGSGSPLDPGSQDTEIQELRKEWGVLPPRLRDELSDGLRERFSPLYRRMTEAYYKALAEQE